MSVLASKRISVGTSATVVVSGDEDGCYVYLKAHSAGSIFLGNGDMTIDNGYELGAGEAIQFAMGANEILYAIVEEGTGELHFLATMNQ